MVPTSLITQANTQAHLSDTRWLYAAHLCLLKNIMDQKQNISSYNIYNV